ncbi:MAG: hypothetical protein JXN65_09635 [Clostridia bacterium]|nr:hypothetical protein [Clostridia bacterium]
MLKMILLPTTLMVGKLTGFVMNIALLVATVGSILLIATLINKHLTKKEQEKSEKEKETGNKE